ncbi:hypothetical protein [Amycolatopsis anabasis]|uniref:hypothetical protein n=1 Tax=Amycolatopsis anabasis TaxID=1840409 RepID=UPI00131B789A|nr:hypothetical protein [Amycolatopsis anabasis]
MTSTRVDPVGQLLAGSAEHALHRFEHRNARVPGSRVVHAMRPTRFLGYEVPGLACGTAVGGWDWTRLDPTHDEVTCAHCLRSAEARAAVSGPAPAHQLTLDLGELLGRAVPGQSQPSHGPVPHPQRE